MKSLNFSELQSYSKLLSEVLDGALVQDCWSDGQTIVLQLYQKKALWLIFDLKMGSGQIICSDKIPPVTKTPKPVTLFIKANLLNQRLGSIEVLHELGRVVKIKFATHDSTSELLINLIPKFENLSVLAGVKSLHLRKPKEIIQREEQSFPVEQILEIDLRAQDWFSERSGQKIQTQGAPVKADDFTRKRDDKIKKLQKIRADLEQRLISAEAETWRKLGEFLKQQTAVPKEYTSLYDSERSRSWNLEHAFSKAKQIEKKTQGMKDRIEQIDREILSLQNSTSLNQAFDQRQKSRASDLLKRTQSEGRRLILENGFEVVFGRTAKENLAVLRQAKPWDLWVHLKDYPSAHAILIRPKKDSSIPIKVVEAAAQWIIKEKLRKQQSPSGIKFDVVVVECRHVKPIKGDKHGLVTFHNGQVFTFASKFS